MKRDLARLESSEFDILVIGGGINGSAIARDAAMRGARVALIEKNDFASGASGKTTKLIHGGIRYLEQFDFKLVYEALRERAMLLEMVPHLVKPIEFLIPVYKNDPRPLFKIKTGVFIYDRLAGGKKIRPHRRLSEKDVISIEPGIKRDGLLGGVIYCDAQMDDISLSIDNAISAYDHGAAVANKVEAAAFIKNDGRITGVEAKDILGGTSFKIRSKTVINATGAWSNKIVRLDDPSAEAITRPTKGVHIVYKKTSCNKAVVLSAHKDKRVFFMIPWRGLTLIGTTDTDYNGSPDEVYAEKAEIKYLLDEARRVFPGDDINEDGIVTTFAALRPLANRKGHLPWRLSREHLIRRSSSGLISVSGGKYTTYRHLAERVVDIAAEGLGSINGKRCPTAFAPPSYPKDGNKDPRALIERAVGVEMANTFDDLMSRRLQLSTTPSLGFDRCREYADIMAEMLGWTGSKKEAEIDLYKKETERNKEALI